ncbi:MAG: aspartate carbamoyltransferase, partial [Proteobacteria bacterium]|nr:aspartate carbamoyltransferase [Pseudomonadota bacterium]
MLYFVQPSTRTFLSFQSACQILGMQCSEIRNPSISSEAKGERVEDAIRTFSSYVDIIIMRSPLPGLCSRMAQILDQSNRPVPIINAGSGPDEHPTQALLDLYTLHRDFKNCGGISGKTICMVGDLKHGRTVRSLARMLVHFPNIHMIFSSPKNFAIKDDIRDYLSKQNHITFSETEEFETLLPQCDALYMTRIQDEWHSPGESFDKERYHLKWHHLKQMKENALILHPFPRREEIEVRVDQDPRAKYWEQERNGMWIRLALISQILNVSDELCDYYDKAINES